MLIGLNLPGQHRPARRSPQSQALGFLRIQAQANLLDVQNDVGDVLQHPMDRGELVLHAGNLDGHKGRPLQRGEQHSPQSVADGGAVAPLQRFTDELAVGGAGGFFFTRDLFRLDQLGPVARVDKAFACFISMRTPGYFE